MVLANLRRRTRKPFPHVRVRSSIFSVPINGSKGAGVPTFVFFPFYMLDEGIRTGRIDYKYRTNTIPSCGIGISVSVKCPIRRELWSVVVRCQTVLVGVVYAV